MEVILKSVLMTAFPQKFFVSVRRTTIISSLDLIYFKNIVEKKISAMPRSSQRKELVYQPITSFLL